MAKFMLLYLGGGGAPSGPPDEKIMQAWMDWFGRLGDAIVDGGTPFGQRATIGGTGASTAGGYSIISADSLDAARAHCDGHPHLMAGGAIEILETVPIGM